MRNPLDICLFSSVGDYVFNWEQANVIIAHFMILQWIILHSHCVIKFRPNLWAKYKRLFQNYYYFLTHFCQHCQCKNKCTVRFRKEVEKIQVISQRWNKIES